MDSLLLSILVVISSIALLVTLSYPYIQITNYEFFLKRKLLFPYYKCKIVLLLTNINNTVKLKPEEVTNLHTSFSSIIAFNIDKLQLVISKYDSKISIYILLSKQGFSKKKLLEQLERELLLVTNALSTNYEGFVNILNSKQSNIILRFLKKKKSKVVLDFSNHLDTELDLVDYFYKTISADSFPDLSSVLGIQHLNKSKLYYRVQYSVLSDNKQSVKHFLKATFTSKKKRSSTSQMEDYVSLEDLHRFFHIPLEYSRVTSHKPKRNPKVKQEESILLGHEYINGLLDEEISINVGELLYNMEIYGMIGRGKTRFASSILDHLIRSNVPSLVFDIKGEYATTFATNPNVEIFTIGEPHPLCINLFDTKDEDDVRGTLLIIEEMIASTEQTFSSSMKNLFETALFLTHKEEKRTLEVFTEHLITLAKSKKQVTTIQNTLEAVLNRINFIFNPSNFEILGVSQTTINFDVMDQGKTIILDLSQFQRRAARPSDIYLVCNLILKLFYRFAASKELTNKLRYVLVLEEAINIIPFIYRTQSSASLITAENNILLGRALGIGHIFCTQMWHSVSNIVHANSSTKVVFRSNQETEKIAKALNLHEFHYERLQQLPIRHCFIWKDGEVKALEMITKEFDLKPLDYQTYLLFLKKKHSSSDYPLLFSSFVDMRTTLHNKLTQTKKPQKKKQQSKKTSNSRRQNPKKEKLQILDSRFKPDDVCKTYCSLNKDKDRCSKIRKDARLANSYLMKKFPRDEIDLAILGEFDVTIDEMFEQILKENKLPRSERILICAQRQLTNRLTKVNIA